MQSLCVGLRLWDLLGILGRFGLRLRRWLGLCVGLGLWDLLGILGRFGRRLKERLGRLRHFWLGLRL